VVAIKECSDFDFKAPVAAVKRCLFFFGRVGSWGYTINTDSFIGLEMECDHMNFKAFFGSIGLFCHLCKRFELLLCLLGSHFEPLPSEYIFVEYCLVLPANL